MIGGAPCGPFSIQGKREGSADPRSNCFLKMVEVSAHLAARKERFCFYIYENSAACQHKESDGLSFADKINDAITSAMPGAQVL